MCGIMAMFSIYLKKIRFVCLSIFAMHVFTFFGALLPILGHFSYVFLGSFQFLYADKPQNQESLKINCTIKQLLCQNFKSHTPDQDIGYSKESEPQNRKHFVEKYIVCCMTYLLRTDRAGKAL